MLAASKTRAFLRLLWVNILVFVVSFIFLEISFRIYYRIVWEQPFFRRNTFVSPWITTYDYPSPYVGKDGVALFRHRKQGTSVEKAVNTIRVAAVGGSTTANERSWTTAEIDYPGELERLLQRRFPFVDFEVFNAGSDAFSTAQSLINIELRLLEFDLDVILLMHNINDSSVNLFLEGATGDYANKYLRPYYLNPSLQGMLSIPGFLSQFRVFQKFHVPQIFASRNHDLRVANSYEKGLQIFERNLNSIALICLSNGVQVVFLTQPYTMEDHEYVNKEAFMAYNNAILNVAGDNGLVAVDLFEEIGQERRYFVDQFHYSPAGIRRVAEVIDTHIAGQIKEIIDASKIYLQPSVEEDSKELE